MFSQAMYTIYTHIHARRVCACVLRTTHDVELDSEVLVQFLQPTGQGGVVVDNSTVACVCVCVCVSTDLQLISECILS